MLKILLATNDRISLRHMLGVGRVRDSRLASDQHDANTATRPTAGRRGRLFRNRMAAVACRIPRLRILAIGRLDYPMERCRWRVAPPWCLNRSVALLWLLQPTYCPDERMFDQRAGVCGCLLSGRCPFRSVKGKPIAYRARRWCRSCFAGRSFRLVGDDIGPSSSSRWLRLTIRGHSSLILRARPPWIGP
jgi:hypothetical protein